jgi:hypothetical protein
MKRPQFPLYIVSKGRADTRLTARHLAGLGIPYFIVVEAQEADAYRAVIEGGEVLVLDPAYQRDYDAFWKLDDGVSRGSGPARNFAWDHAIASGAEWHWCMDDNINGFFRYHRNKKTPCTSPALFAAMEDFVLRYKNVGMAGPQYAMFVTRKRNRWPPFVLNTRIYSCNLIRNALPMRWRGRYNEDTDLSLRVLKAKWVTVLFNAFLQWKMPTLTMKGGNTDTIYVGGTDAKSRMICEMHPDVAQMHHRFGRPHHLVNYDGFDQRLVFREGFVAPSEADNYGMELQTDIPMDERGAFARKFR